MDLFVYLLIYSGALRHVLAASTSLKRQVGVDPVRPIEYLGHDDNGHSKGDIHIQLMQSEADTANKYFGATGESCLGSSKKRAPDADTIDVLFQNLQEATWSLAPGQGLNTLVPRFQGVPADFPMPNFQDPIAAAAFGQFVPFAAEYIPVYAPNLPQNQVIPAATFLFFLVFAQQMTCAIFVGKDLYLKAKDLVSTANFKLECPDIDSAFAPHCSKWYCNGNAGRCTYPIMKPCVCVPTECPAPPQDMYTCSDENCNGEDGYCRAKDTKNCECVNEVTTYSQPGDEAWANTQIAINYALGLYVAPIPDEPVITDGSGSGQCGNGKTVGSVGITSKKINKNSLQKCLKNLDTTKWLTGDDVYICDGMVQFESASSGWTSPADCWNSCKNCLSQAISDGVNQIWCDAYAGFLNAAHCWMGFRIPDPPLITDGTSIKEDQMRIDAKDGWRDKWAAQDCLKNFPTDRFYDEKMVACPGARLNFGSGHKSWDSASDCYNALKNCVSLAINRGASQAWCDAYAGWSAHCWLGFQAM